VDEKMHMGDGRFDQPAKLAGHDGTRRHRFILRSP
jgi:hypothetical protein